MHSNLKGDTREIFKVCSHAIHRTLSKGSFYLAWSHLKTVNSWSIYNCLDTRTKMSKRVLTGEILSRNETRPGTKSSLSMVKYLLLFTHICRNVISSQDELIPVKKTEMKFHPGMKKKKKRRVNTSSRDEILKWECFF